MADTLDWLWKKPAAAFTAVCSACICINLPVLDANYARDYFGRIDPVSRQML
jgi:hypothetical protein